MEKFVLAFVMTKERKIFTSENYYESTSTHSPKLAMKVVNGSRENLEVWAQSVRIDNPQPSP